MPIAYSHVTDTKHGRTYSGEKEARDIIGWLNFRQRKEFEHVYEQLAGKGSLYHEQRRVAEILRLYERERIDWEKRFGDHDKDSTRRPFEKKKPLPASRKLERLLRRYTFYPRFFPMGRLLSFAWQPVRPDHPDRYGEVSAIADLAKLAEKDLLGHLRECPCGKWFWARFSHQRFCSSKCRESEFRSSDKWKEHRRQKAREYYQLHKSGKVK